MTMSCALWPSQPAVLMASVVAEPLPMSTQLVRTVSRPAASSATSAMTPSVPVP